MIKGRLKDSDSLRIQSRFFLKKFNNIHIRQNNHGVISWQKNISVLTVYAAKLVQFPINPDFVLKLGYAAGQVLVQHEGEMKPTVLIGKDTRISGYMLEAALIAGFTAAGVNVIQTGPLPTPGVAT